MPFKHSSMKYEKKWGEPIRNCCCDNHFDKFSPAVCGHYTKYGCNSFFSQPIRTWRAAWKMSSCGWFSTLCFMCNVDHGYFMNNPEKTSCSFFTEFMFFPIARNPDNGAKLVWARWIKKQKVSRQLELIDSRTPEGLYEVYVDTFYRYHLLFFWHFWISRPLL